MCSSRNVTSSERTLSVNIMKRCRVIEGLLLLLLSGHGCNAMLGRRNIAIPITASIQRHNERPISVGSPHTRCTTRSRVTAAVASTSHLTTGRTASGVIENCMEGALSTIQSFVAGSVMGCVIGGFTGGTFGKVPDVGWLKSVQMKAVEMGGNWGTLSAAFSGFTSVSTIVRARNDKWDQVLGACGAGAFLNRAKGPQGMVQGAATYGLFSLVFAFPAREDELDVVDVPVDAPIKR
ncbi:unnamed protein product [Pylaiella littoralis]